FFSIVMGEFVGIKLARMLLLPGLIIGSLSIVYWQMTANNGAGDLRFYALVQFLPLVLIPTILLLFESGTNSGYVFWWVLLAYVCAKVFEIGDQYVFNWSKLVSGHSIKHIFAAIGPFLFLILYCR